MRNAGRIFDRSEIPPLTMVTLSSPPSGATWRMRLGSIEGTERREDLTVEAPTVGSRHSCRTTTPRLPGAKSNSSTRVAGFEHAVHRSLRTRP